MKTASRLTKEESESKLKADRAEYIRELVAKAPPLTPSQISVLTVIFSGGRADDLPPAPPTARELAVKELARLRAEVKELPKAMAKDMDKCGMCELPRVAHHVQKTHGLFHDPIPMDPDQVIKIARKYKRLITAAEKRVSEAEAKL